MIIRVLCLLVGTVGILQKNTYAVVNNREFKRREAVVGGGGISNSYGPPPLPSSPLPIPVYGVPGPAAKYPPPPPDIPPPLPSGQTPHKEYGPPRPSLPAPTPSREYGVPFLQYGPPKVNIEYGIPLFKNVPLKNSFASLNSFQSGKSSIYDQIKSHFGVPKPVYGPPHLQRPNALPSQNSYLPPIQSYGAPHKPSPSFSSSNFGHSLKLSPVYGVPHFGHSISSHSAPKPSISYGTPSISSFGVSSQSAPVYGPPSINIAPTYVPPPPSSPSQPTPVYGPPPKPSYRPQPPSTSYGVPSISTSSSNLASHSIKQVHIIEGNDHGGPTVSCDGWKPIPGPVGLNLQGHDNSALNIGYNTGYSTVHTSTSGSSRHQHGNVLAGLTDEQLVAIALQGDGGSQQIAIAADDDFHSAHNSLDTNLLQSHSLELPAEGLSDTYGAPPLDSYAPNSVHAIKYDTINLSQNDPIGLVPPSGVYGPPSEPSRHVPAPLPAPPPPPVKIHGTGGLGISYGSQSGNLKPWTQPGLPPKKPVLYRPPVPQGLLESIGAAVQHLDQYGVPPPNEPPSYIPPPPAEIPQQINSEDHQLGSHSEHVPSIQEPRFNQAQDCGHGPSLNGGGGGGEFGNYELSSNQVTSYSNIEAQKQQLVETSGNHAPTDSYGPPPSGNAADAHTYESKQNSVHILSQTSNAHSHTSADNQNDSNNSNYIDQQKYEQADKSYSQNTVTIPVQGQLGSYQLQFQSADSFGGNPSEHTNHEQILSEGLLQTILSAIEQPNPSLQQQQNQQNQQEQQQHHQSDTINSRADHKDADEFLRSQEVEKALSESNEKSEQN